MINPVYFCLSVYGTHVNYRNRQLLLSEVSDNVECRKMKNLIKVERARHNLTQADLAEKVNVARQTIIAIEANKFVPSTVLAFKIAKVLHCKADDIFELEEGDWQ